MKSIAVSQLEQIEDKITIIDIRDREDYIKEAYPGAINEYELIKDGDKIAVCV